MHALFFFMRWLCLAEAVAAVAGIVTLHKWKQSYLKWFVVYLIIISVFEIAVRILIYLKRIDDVVLANQTLAMLEILFVNWFFYKTLARNKSKIIIAGVLIYIASFVTEKKIIDNADYYFESLSYTVGNLFILIYLILFFLELARSEKILEFHKLAVFWIASGMLVFYLGTFPFFGLYNELIKNLSLFIPLAWAETSLNYIMYILFTIGLLWGKPH